LESQIAFYAKAFPREQIKTIYFGWWTPLSLWKSAIIKLIEQIKNSFDLEFLEEISFELNPNPYDEVLEFIKTINEKYKNFYRIRYSIWIQSFDDEVLKLSWRDYFFNSLMWFIRDLTKYKNSNVLYNLDFIAFGKYNTTKKWEKKLRDEKKILFFQKLIGSNFIDSYSLYTLELFPWSFWFDRLISKDNKEEKNDDIYEEFDFLKQIIENSGYKRYEISNFALSWKISINNNVYWNMWNYIGLWISAHSFLWEEYLEKFTKIYNEDQKIDSLKGVRFENTQSWDGFIKKDFVNKAKNNYLSEKDYLIEKFFLWLRTTFWLTQLDTFDKILIKNYKQKIEEYQNLWFLIFEDDRLNLTSKGMDLYNEIITTLIQEFK